MSMSATVPLKEGEAPEASTSAPAEAAGKTSKVVVGYALSLKKKNSFLRPKFLNVARTKGIEFVPIDVNKPLSEQGPFDIILHKIEGKEWTEAVKGLKPDVIVLDPPDSIQRLRNRQLMLEVVSDLKFQDSDGNELGHVRVPRQVVSSSNPASIPDEVSKAGLKVPIVVKPLLLDETAKSHELSLAYDLPSLAKLNELDGPVVLQEFINHGAVLFKVFVVGEAVQVVTRPSLCDVFDYELSLLSGIIPLYRVSSAEASSLIAVPYFELPPQPLIEGLVKDLREKLGLRLFNIDVIKKRGSKEYYVVDINYFPGYAKMPGYEDIFSEFLVSLGPSMKQL
ncbi:inositol-tetrakisphosphate 1-kinase 3-like [Andrographis paniculata]|uniref:inositol-tetrakisphosphate 1-kinase 3-like n=1 Tax=Andrographis paniculata TaxID=175694 RepID=UPI0021E82E53|nr:inositol-tetrakisphosphate 1-kinase 3-like [Andrographis paniculata]